LSYLGGVSPSHQERFSVNPVTIAKNNSRTLWINVYAQRTTGIHRFLFLGSNTMIRFQVNGKAVSVDVDPTTPLLWALRDNLDMTGTKFGCGMALCGACTVHMDGQPMRACVTPISAIAGKNVITIESMASDKVGKAVQDAWVQHDVAQCGYCQSGQVMSATALLKGKKNPTDADIDAAMAGNICRCGTYTRVRAAIKDAAIAIA
jgi:isoquinoline 1-oxidoreductase subunit alpha